MIGRWTGTVSPTFPDGATVGAYPATSIPSGYDRGPLAAALETATVVNGTVTFSDLTAYLPYVLGAQVSGSWRYMQITASADVDATGNEAQEDEILTGVWDFAHGVLSRIPPQSDNYLARQRDLQRYAGGRMLWEFAAGVDDTAIEALEAGTESASDIFNTAITEYLNVEDRPVLIVPPSILLLEDTLEPITASLGARIVTSGRGANRLLMADGAASARFFDIGDGAQQVKLDEFTYAYETEAANADSVIRLGDVAECDVNGGRIVSAGAGVLFDEGGGRNRAMYMRGSIDLTKGGNWFENAGQVGWKLIDNHVNAGGTDGAGQGGGMIVIRPTNNGTADGGHIMFNEFQGANSQGTDWGIRIDGTDAKAINNQFFLRNTTDHTCRFTFDLFAPPGSSVKSRAINVWKHRSAGDAQALYRFCWQSDEFCQDFVYDGIKNGYRVNPRPVCVSSAYNNFRPDIRMILADSSPGSVSTPDKVVASFACGKWTFSGRIADSGDEAGGLFIRHGGEALPYKVDIVTVDTDGTGTFVLSKAGGGSTAALDADLDRAALETALTTLYGTTVVVEGGPGGSIGPLRTRLAEDYSGEATMHLVSTSGMPASGTVRFGGYDVEIPYTGISGNDLTGCTTGLITDIPAGNTVFNLAANDGPGMAFAVIYKGTYAPTATTAPGFDGTADVPELTADDSLLGPTSGGGAGQGRGTVTIDTAQWACPLDNYEWWTWDPATDQTDTSDAAFADCELGYTTGFDA